MKRAIVLMGGLWCATCIPVMSRADDGQAMIVRGDAAYAKREDLAQAKIALSEYDSAASASTGSVVEANWKASRVAWWLGEHAATRKERLEYFQSGMAYAQKAIDLDPNRVEPHFWFAGNAGSYGEAKGVLKSLSLVKPIRHAMAEVIRIDDHYLGGGAYRVLGVVDYKVPGFAGGSKTRAEAELKKALGMDPNDPFTHYYLAEFYQLTGDKDNSRNELEALKTLSVPTDSLPELHMLQKRAQARLE